MRVRVVIGLVLALVGAVWFLQGIGVIGGSFMSGEAVWAVIGAACMLGGAWLAVGGRRARRS